MNKICHMLLDLRSYSPETDSHSHDYHQLVLPVAGTLDMQIGTQHGQVNASRAAIIHAGEDHGFAGSSDNCFLVADIPESLAPEFARLPPFLQLTPAIATYVSFLQQQLQQHNSESSQRQMLLLLIQLLYENQGNTIKLDRRIAVARDYLDQHFSEPVSLQQVAGLSGLSSRQLSELFRRQLGMTPQQYLIEKRMQYAWQLLENGADSVQQVAEAVGYASLSSFSDRFHKHFNISPGYFRRFREK